MNPALPPLHPLRSLRAKGLLATLALLLYIGSAGLYIASERGRIYASMQSLEQIGRHEKAVALTEAAVSGALLDVSEASNASVVQPAPPQELVLYMENCARLFATLDEFDPGYQRLRRAIVRSYDALQAQTVRANWIDLREALHRAADELDIRRQSLAAQRETITQAYQRQYDAVTVESLLLATLGLVVFGTLAAWFFAQLARDIRRLEQHASQIVGGTRGVSLSVRRHDELGHLMHAVNRMSADLDEREQRIRLDGELRSHDEKMRAVGALAAGVAHEVNNPLAVISGVAQELGDAQAAADPERVRQAAELILAQTQRAAHATRHLAEVAAPQPADLDWLSLNDLVRACVQLMGYDRRYRQVQVEMALDAQLPAVQSSPGALQQLLMQLLSLACEAMAAQGSARELQLITGATEGRVWLHMQLSAALDFRRPEVQRSLLLCRAIAEPLQAELAFGQASEGHPRIKLTLPADSGG